VEAEMMKEFLPN